MNRSELADTGFNIGDTVRWRNPNFETLSESNAQLVLATSSNEAKCATLAILDKIGPSDNEQLRTAILDTCAASSVDYTPEFSQPYFSEVCKQLNKLGIVNITPGDRAKGTKNIFSVNHLGGQLILPWEGHLISWATRNCLNLKSVFGEPRATKPGEIPGATAQIAVLALLSSGKKDEKAVKEFIRTEICHPETNEGVFYKLCKKLTNHPFIELNDGGVGISERYKAVVDELLQIYQGMITLDPAFIRKGHDLISAIADDPTHIAMLLKRTEKSSTKAQDKPADYQEFVPPLLARIAASGGAIAMSSIDRSAFPELSASQLQKLRRTIRTGGLPGIHAIITGPSLGHNSTTHIKVVAQITNDF